MDNGSLNQWVVEKIIVLNFWKTKWSKMHAKGYNTVLHCSGITLINYETPTAFASNGKL